MEENSPGEADPWHDKRSLKVRGARQRPQSGKTADAPQSRSLK